MWTIPADQGLVSLGFALAGEADVSAYRRRRGYCLMTTDAQASVWLAGEVQEELAGFEFVQWPISGERILQPRIVHEDACWVDPATGVVVARIGNLCRGT